MSTSTSSIRMVSLSGGKDSLAMALRLLEEEPGDDLRFVFFDFGLDYPETYATIERFQRETGAHVHTIKPPHDFVYYAAEKPLTRIRTKKTARMTQGYGWPAPFRRWCTKIKTTTLERFKKERFPGCAITTCIGIAADEPKRIRHFPNVRYPLIEWGMTEADCLAYCRARGYFPPGHPYDHLKRVSCYACPLCSNADIAYLIRHRPELWANIKALEKKIGFTWKYPNRGTAYFESKFATPLFDQQKEESK